MCDICGINPCDGLHGITNYCDDCGRECDGTHASVSANVNVHTHTFVPSTIPPSQCVICDGNNTDHVHMYSCDSCRLDFKYSELQGIDSRFYCVTCTPYIISENKQIQNIVKIVSSYNQRVFNGVIKGLLEIREARWN